MDVSKAFLDVVVHGQKRSRRFTNEANGFAQLLLWLKSDPHDFGIRYLEFFHGRGMDSCRRWAASFAARILLLRQLITTATPTRCKSLQDAQRNQFADVAQCGVG